MQLITKSCLIVGLLTLLAAAPAAAVQTPACRSCGCHCNLRKVCRLKCEIEEVPRVCFDCECEDFCVPYKSCLVGTKCEPDCCAPHGFVHRKIWQPSPCAEVRTRKVLVVKEVPRKVPVYKWVVEYVCPACACGNPAEGVPEEAPPAEAAPTELDVDVDVEDGPPLPPPASPPPPAPRAAKSGWSLSRLFSR